MSAATFIPLPELTSALFPLTLVKYCFSLKPETIKSPSRCFSVSKSPKELVDSTKIKSIETSLLIKTGLSFFTTPDGDAQPTRFNSTNKIAARLPGLAQFLVVGNVANLS